MEALIVLNTGSSSMKFSIFSIEKEVMNRKYTGSITDLSSSPHIKIIDNKKNIEIEEDIKVSDDKKTYIKQCLHYILKWVAKKNIKIIAAGHRIVHGGCYNEAKVLNNKTLEYLQTLIPFSPLHQPYNLNGYIFFKEEIKNLFQAGAFDSAFHSTCDKISQSYALPKDLTNLGIRRYGFHGLSYEYIVSQMPKYMSSDEANKKFIIAHLGSGSTMCAIKHLKSAATSIGLTSMGGLPMSTRCGDVDPYLGVYLIDQLGYTPQQVQNLYYKESGLLGVSKISSDMEKLLKSNHPDAKLAVDIFIHRVCGFAGSLTSELQGLDGFIFTGGIGESSCEIRQRVVNKLSWLGLELDDAKNIVCKKQPMKISKSSSKVSVYVIPTDEEVIIAKHIFNLYKKHKSK